MITMVALSNCAPLDICGGGSMATKSKDITFSSAFFFIFNIVMVTMVALSNCALLDNTGLK